MDLAFWSSGLRELYEETGITSNHVEVLAELKGWVHYDWPKNRQQEKRAMGATNWRGQRQVWQRLRHGCTLGLLQVLDLVAVALGVPEGIASCLRPWK